MYRISIIVESLKTVSLSFVLILEITEILALCAEPDMLVLHYMYKVCKLQT